MSEPQTGLADEVKYVVNRVYPRYSRWVEKPDLAQELYLYALDRGAKRLNQWRELGDQHRVYLALFGAARQYCEGEKAVKSGYQFEDVAWYSPAKLADLLPLALDPRWDGLTGASPDENTGGGKQSAGREGGTLLAMVADVRRAVEKCGPPYMNPEDPAEYDPVYLSSLADFLGGEFPESPAYQRGRRTVVSNAAAIARTEAQ